MRRRYYSGISSATNTCSIRSLKRAFIGNGVRMSSDKNTVSFENVPMKGTVIESYNEQGFRISHPALPKAVWVNFEQLPLTRLQINNGVISDEITFVENIVNHQMQLIRTLDTEYMDMIYKEKALDEKKDEIIPISAAIPGQIYIGAQCEEGTEMIFLGTFFIKSLRTKTSYSSSYYNRRDETKYYFEKLSPPRAFFAVSGDEVSSKEEKDFVNQFFGSEEARWKLDHQERNRIDKLMFDAKKKYLAEQKIPRFKILEFAVTSKRIKDVILTNQENPLFLNKEQNKEYLLSFLSGQIPEASQYTICNRYGIDDVFFINDDKNTTEEKGRVFAKEKKNIVIESGCWEDRFKKN
jgi:hypothetical protein